MNAPRRNFFLVWRVLGLGGFEGEKGHLPYLAGVQAAAAQLAADNLVLLFG